MRRSEDDSVPSGTGAQAMHALAVLVSPAVELDRFRAGVEHIALPTGRQTSCQRAGRSPRVRVPDLARLLSLRAAVRRAAGSGAGASLGSALPGGRGP